MKLADLIAYFKKHGRFYSQNTKHGTITGYVYGCRCELCKKANYLRNRDYSEQRKEEKSYKHGTISGYNFGCRCDECKEASRLKYLRNKKGQ